MIRFVSSLPPENPNRSVESGVRFVIMEVTTMESYRSFDFSIDNRISWMTDGSVANRFTERSSANSLALLHFTITTEFADIRFLYAYYETKGNAYTKDESNIFQKDMSMVWYNATIYYDFCPLFTFSLTNPFCEIFYVFSKQLRTMAWLQMFIQSFMYCYLLSLSSFIFFFYVVHHL